MHQKNNFIGFLFLNFTLEIILLIFLIPGLFFLPGLILFFLLYIVFIAGILYSSYALFTKAAGSFYKIVILNLTHTAFLAPLIFTFIAGLGGVSQAVVEGAAGNVLYRYAQYAIYTAVILSIAQIFIIPWSLFCNYLLKKAK